MRLEITILGDLFTTTTKKLRRVYADLLDSFTNMTEVFMNLNQVSHLVYPSTIIFCLFYFYQSNSIYYYCYISFDCVKVMKNLYNSALLVPI